MNLGHWWDLVLMAGLVGSTVLLLGPRIITASLPAMVAALGALCRERLSRRQATAAGLTRQILLPSSWPMPPAVPERCTKGVVLLKLVAQVLTHRKKWLDCAFSGIGDGARGEAPLGAKIAPYPPAG